MPTAWWVNQGSTYEQERKGGYVWAPAKTKAGHPVAHHVNVSRLTQGDAIVHYANGSIRSIGIVKENGASHTRPAELPVATWAEEGYLARVEYHDLAEPITLSEISDRTPDAGPFNGSGGVNQGYLFPLSPKFAARLYDRFTDRWPIAWSPANGSPTEESTQMDGWDEFVYWARKFKEWPRFDEAERDYKLRLAERLAAARAQFSSDNQEWIEALRKAVTSKDNNITSWRIHNPFLDWAAQEPNEARVVLGHLWNDPTSVEQSVQAFTGAVPLPPKAGKSGPITLASVLLAGVDVLKTPPYRKKPYYRGYDLTGHARPSGDASSGEIYAHALRFLDRILTEASSRGLVLRDRLDAQSVLWSISQGNEVEEWSEAEKARFQRFLKGTGIDDDDDVDDLDELAKELHLDVDYLRRIQQLLEHKRQVVFYGPPGTGKTFVAKKLAELFAADGGAVEKVQFHPSYAYEDFVEGYRPRLTDGQAGFVLSPGPLRRIAAKALQTDATCVLLIDEINRGNVAKIFGELYYLLEYRDEQISLQYSAEPASLPKNLWIIGTMNTADRSIALVDAALRRRFHFVKFYPDEAPVHGLLRKWLRDEKPELLWVADVVDKANELLGNSHMAIGPSHFMRTDLTDDWVGLIWEHSVLPFIAEQFFGDEARLEAFALEKLRQTPASPSEN